MQHLTDISLAAVVLGLGNIVGKLGLPKKLIPLCNIVISLALVFLEDEGPWSAKILEGIILGLTASGLYSGMKNVTEHIKKNK